MKELDNQVVSKAQQWLGETYDEATRTEVQRLLDEDPKELTESFYRSLEFGTGGLRGIMGVGTNRMNIYTVGMATQGLSNYLKEAFPTTPIKVAVAHDSRNNSRLFSEHVARIFAANGFQVYLFDSLRPTPELSFAIRHLNCQSGVVITASHNPKEYNGYKAYWNDGAQVIPPHDKNIISHVEKITSPDQVLTQEGMDGISILDESFDHIYLEAVKELSLSPEAIEKHHDISIVYTPIHGTGVILIPASLKNYGFTNIHTVKAQNIVDGNFPTVASPNPEEQSTMQMALDLAAEVKAELVLATDPDADRLGVALPDDAGNYILLNGNQTMSLLLYYMVKRWHELGKITGKEYIIKTIVTTDLVNRIADDLGVKCYDCLTGFKYIAAIIREQEGKTHYICGGEESFGFLAGDIVRDKDAVSACSIAAEAAAWAKSQGSTLYQLLKETYLKYGLFREGLVSVVRKGKEGAEEIRQMMSEMRQNPPKTIGGSPVITIKDYDSSLSIDLRSGKQTPLEMDRSNVLQFLMEDDTLVSVRPSGTEPKIKFYFGVRGQMSSIEQYEAVYAELGERIEALKKELNLI